MGAAIGLPPAGRCLLAASGQQVAPIAYWYDGTSAWMSASASSALVAALQRDADCALWVGDVLARGVARVFSLRDPVGLAFHGATIAAAMTALAATNVRRILDARRLLPTNRVALRVTVAQTEQVSWSAPPPGIAPALPTVVPPDVRRALAGQRQVVLAAQHDRLQVSPAVWGAGFALTGVRPGTEAVAVLDDGHLGVAVAGTVGQGALRPERVTWWHGVQVESADVPPLAAAAPGGITLPD